LIENDKDVENGTYRRNYASITTPASIDEIKLYKKLTSVFVQNNLNINLRAETLSVEEILELYKLIVGVK
jgi:16S rRNA A1518/A1519 N6-dimethyltransferase RsmA/KsgA/DIM1 with predicted DNA glycosylase/AP lyase activity